MDIRPPKNYVSKKSPGNPQPMQAARNTPVLGAQNTLEENLPNIETPFLDSASSSPPSLTKPRKLLKRIILSSVAIATLAIIGAVLWYNWAISPYSQETTSQTFVVAAGETAPTVAKHLEEKHIIRSAFALEIYARLQNRSGSFMTGTYSLSPSQSVADIVAKIVAGKSDVRSVLIPPGLTLKQLADPTVKGSFASQGFSDSDIQAAFSATYTSPLLKDKPSDATLEGYIFPETFQIRTGDTLQLVLEKSFNELYGRLQKDGMLQKFSAHGLTLHQALTLGSIIQEESGNPAVQMKIAEVFYNRLQQGISLGSDVTFIYAARQLGVAPSVDLNSPYNTRLHAGLPPGPIATMNYSALQAVADPAVGDYLFFVAGDDGTVYFSRTNDEHNAQVKQYCQKLCSETPQ